MQACFYIMVRNSFSINFSICGSRAWWSRAHDCPGYPGQSAKSNGHVGGQHDVSENALYRAHTSSSQSKPEICMHMFNKCAPIVSPGLRKPRGLSKQVWIRLISLTSLPASKWRARRSTQITFANLVHTLKGELQTIFFFLSKSIQINHTGNKV